MLPLLTQLYFSFFQVGLFSIGGGYAALPLIQSQVIDLHHWLTMDEFLDVLTISQMTPGPIAINSATFVGLRLAGILGAIVATVGCVTPSCLIVLFMAWLYKKYKNLPIVQGILQGLRPAVVALIATAGVSIFTTALLNKEMQNIALINISPTPSPAWLDTLILSLARIDWIAAIIFALSLFALRKYKLNPIYAMLLAGAIGAVVFYVLPLGG